MSHRLQAALNNFDDGSAIVNGFNYTACSLRLSHDPRKWHEQIHQVNFNQEVGCVTELLDVYADGSCG